MSIKKWNTLSNSILVDTPVFKLRSLERQRPGRGTERPPKFYVLDVPDWVNVVAITPDNKIVMIRQYRQGNDEVTIEIPGGMIDPDEKPLDAAKRELREETGYTSNNWIKLGRVAPNPAIQNNLCDTFLALDAECTNPTDFDEHEYIEVEFLDPNDAWDAVLSGRITHALVVCALSFYQSYVSRNSLKSLTNS